MNSLIPQWLFQSFFLYKLKWLHHQRIIDLSLSPGFNHLVFMALDTVGLWKRFCSRDLTIFTTLELSLSFKSSDIFNRHVHSTCYFQLYTTYRMINKTIKCRSNLCISCETLITHSSHQCSQYQVAVFYFSFICGPSYSPVNPLSIIQCVAFVFFFLFFF